MTNDQADCILHKFEYLKKFYDSLYNFMMMRIDTSGTEEYKKELTIYRTHIECLTVCIKIVKDIAGENLDDN